MRLLPYEIWQDIPGYEGLYQASTEGDIGTIDHITQRNKKGPIHIKSRVLIKCDNQKGYHQVRLYKNGKGKTWKVHQLIMLTFVGPKPPGMQVNHKDENKHNNALWNLEYCSNVYNSNYASRNRRISDHFKNGPTSKKVFQYSIDGELVNVYQSACEAARICGYNQPSISRCCNGGLKSYKGYIWQFSSD